MNHPAAGPMSPHHHVDRPDSVDLIGPLRRHAAGVHADTAAVDLLVGQRTWLSRPDFGCHIHHHPAPQTRDTGPGPGYCCPGPASSSAAAALAWIDWQAALTALTGGQLPCTGSEAAVLRIAAALGADLPVSLRQVLGGLDRPTIAAITTAITRANGA